MSQGGRAERGTTRPWPAVPISDGAVGVVAALGTALYLLRYFNCGLNPLDEGFALVTGLRVLQGQVPYRDFFSQLSPAVFYTQAALFRLFGTAVLPGRYAMVTVGSLMAGLLYLLGRRVLPLPLALLAVAIWAPWGIPTWFLPSYSWYAALGTLATLYCVVRHAEGGGLRWLWASGLLLGLTALYKQNAGLYLLITFLVFLAMAPFLRWGSRRQNVSERGREAPVAAGKAVRNGIVLALGTAVVVVPALGALAFAGALPAMWRDTVTVVVTIFPREMSLPYGAMLPPWPASFGTGDLSSWAQRLLYLLPVVIYPGIALGVAGRAVAGRIAPRHRILLLLALAGGFSWLETFPRADISHLLFFLGPAYILAVHVAHALASRTLEHGHRAARHPRWALGLFSVLLLVLLVPLLGLLAVGAGTNEEARAAATVALDTSAPRAAGILVPADQEHGIAQIMATIATTSRPREPIFIIPWSVIFYFLADRPNPSRFDLLIPASLLPEDQPDVVRTLERRKVRLVIYQTLWDVNGKTFAENAPTVDAYVTSRYRQIGHIDGGGPYTQYDIWIRSP